MEKPLEAYPFLEPKYPFFDPETGVDIKEDGIAFVGVDSPLDLVSLYEEPKMPELDLTKPLRIRREVTYDPYRGERFYYSGLNAQDGRLAGYVMDVYGFPLSKLMKPEELENIPPEPVKHIRFGYLREDGEIEWYRTSEILPPHKEQCAQLRIWRDEDGKTKVEVCDD